MLNKKIKSSESNLPREILLTDEAKVTIQILYIINIYVWLLVQTVQLKKTTTTNLQQSLACLGFLFSMMYKALDRNIRRKSSQPEADSSILLHLVLHRGSLSCSYHFKTIVKDVATGSLGHKVEISQILFMLCIFGKKSLGLCTLDLT